MWEKVQKIAAAEKRSFRNDDSKDKPFLKFKLSCATFLHQAILFYKITASIRT